MHWRAPLLDLEAGTPTPGLCVRFDGLALAITLCVVLCAVLCAVSCAPTGGPATRDADPALIVLITPPPLERAQTAPARRGTGWYPNVEVDAQDRIHLAWTDADAGDVLYAMAPPGSAVPDAPEIVEAVGAAGSFLQLALAPGGTPIVSFHHQGDHALRMAHRPADLPSMKEAGAAVAVPEVAKGGVRKSPRWRVEDVGTGRDVGAGSALVIDGRGYPHLLFSAKGDRVRLARRPAGTPAFGAVENNAWEIADVASASGQAPAVRHALVVMDDGTEVAAFCDFRGTHSVFRVAVRLGNAEIFREMGPLHRDVGFVGVSSTLWRRADGRVDVAFMDDHAGLLRLGVLDVKPIPSLGRTEGIARVNGPAIAQRASDGTLWVLGWSAKRGQDDVASLQLLEHPRGDASKARRTVLEDGAAPHRTFVDLALRADGRPVAVWFSDDAKGLKLYAP